MDLTRGSDASGEVFGIPFVSTGDSPADSESRIGLVSGTGSRRIVNADLVPKGRIK
jgi:hypothetical protein